MKEPFPYRSQAIPYSYNRNYPPQYYQSYSSPYQMNIPGYTQPNLPMLPYPQYQVNGSLQQMAPMFQQQGHGHTNDSSQQPYIFQNPLQADDNYNKNSSNGHNSYPNPYPKGNFNPKPSQGGVSSLMNSFKSQDGSIDFNKMINTAGQMMNAVNQVSSMVKGFGGFFKA